MSSPRATVLLVVPGQSTVRFELPSLWRYQVLAVLCLFVGMGAAARHGFEAWRGPRRALLRAAELTGSVRALDPALGVVTARLGAPLARAAAQTRPVALVSAARNSLRAFGSRPRAPKAASASASAQPARTAAIAPAVLSAQPILRAFRARPALAAADADDATEPTELRLHALRLGEAVRVQPFDATGAAQPEAFAALSHLMRCRVTGEEIAIDPRLVRILTRLAAGYGRPIQLISGHRAAGARGTSETSQHTTGRAADIRIAGVPIEELRRQAIALGATGVGLYPEKGFVHVDVRTQRRFYWLYTEAAGERPYDRALSAAPLVGTSSPSTAPTEPDHHAEGE